MPTDVNNELRKEILQRDARNENLSTSEIVELKDNLKQKQNIQQYKEIMS